MDIELIKKIWVKLQERRVELVTVKLIDVE